MSTKIVGLRAPSSRPQVRRVRAIAMAAALCASLFAAALGAIGCGGGTVCDEAVGKLADECDLGGAVGVPGAGGIVECKERVSCNAECVLNASCEEIVSDKGTTGYEKCLAACAKKKF